MTNWLDRLGPMTALLPLLAVVLGSPLHAETPRIAIVIDDVGYQWHLDQRAMDLEGPVALGIIPESPHAYQLARRAEARDREVWAHLPLAGLRYDNCQAGLTCLDANWSHELIREHLTAQLALVPGAIGINNHQGSQFTSDPFAVSQLINAITDLNRERGQPLIVMDSRTVINSQLERLAKEAGLDTLSRRVFLDHRNEWDAIESAWDVLIRLAHRHGQAIAIGHSRQLTLEFLESALIDVSDQGVILVAPSEMLPPRRRSVSLPIAP
ncbi:MAG: divergent polysaccharide deacetylase family protein [Pseudomonadota bacterium]